MQRYGQRLSHRRSSKVAALRHHKTLRLGGHNHLAKYALNVREKCRAAIEIHRQTNVPLARLAGAADATRLVRIDRHAIAFFHPRDSGTDLVDFARHFMTQTKWLHYRKITNAPFAVIR